MKITECRYIITKEGSQTISSINTIGFGDSNIAPLFRGVSSPIYRKINSAIKDIPEINPSFLTIIVEEGMFGDTRLMLSSKVEILSLSKKIEAAMGIEFNKCIQVVDVEISLKTSIPYISAKILGKSKEMIDKIVGTDAINKIPGIVSIEPGKDTIKVSYMPSFVETGNDLDIEESIRKVVDVAMSKI